MWTLIDYPTVLVDQAAGKSIPKVPGNRDYDEVVRLQAQGQVLLVPPPPDPPPTLDEQLAQTDKFMARAAEDLVALLIAKGTIAAADLSPALRTRINARRALRGQPPI